jgi:hypothetical protein
VSTIVGLIAIGEFIGRGVNFTKTWLNGDKSEESDYKSELFDEITVNNTVSVREINWN